ncbi:MAG: archease [Armatimonadota bacterium]|nr:archease [Armatimonadota bacterium]MDR7422689.1 archease [Armatimonadota bacterium]MDR7455185.1 archease [Armatimonadota bacterium]MDR7511256.1 archease [Armatimonadota bacterium]
MTGYNGTELSRVEHIDHTADVGIVVRAATLPELFEAAAEGMFGFIVDSDSVASRAWVERRVEADDLPGLLVAWLNDLLAMLAADGFVPKTFVVDEVGERRLRATVHGEPVDVARHRFRLDVKAATYHMLDVRQTDGEWTARVIFDV